MLPSCLCRDVPDRCRWSTSSSARSPTERGNFTFDNILGLAAPQIVSAYWVSIRISAVSAVLGAVIGLAHLARHHPRPPAPGAAQRGGDLLGRRLQFRRRAACLRLHLATLGRLGLVTIILKTLGFDLYRSGFNLLSFWGLTLTYLYFQIPLMVLIISPAVEGLKKEWNEAAQTLGATNFQFWRYIGMPVLWPSILGTLSLLFANAFGAIATAYALTGSSINIVTAVLYAQIRGDVPAEPRPRRRAGARHDRHRQLRQRHLPRHQRACRTVASMKSNRFWSWLVFSGAALYFIVPLIATFEFSLRMRRGVYSFDAYASVFGDPRFQATFSLLGIYRAADDRPRRPRRRAGRLLCAPAGWRGCVR